MESNTFAGRRILITGSGTGIGAVTARLLSGYDAVIAILDRDGAAAEHTSQSIGSERSLWLKGDVTDERAIADVIRAMLDRGSHCHCGVALELMASKKYD